jgi:hypothetical protein
MSISTSDTVSVADVTSSASSTNLEEQLCIDDVHYPEIEGWSIEMVKSWLVECGLGEIAGNSSQNPLHLVLINTISFS